MHQETIFIVDDDGSVRDALMLLLSLRGHVCAAFASAEDFLSALQPTWQGCVVVDIRMSGMSGLQLQAWLGEHHPALQVIVITAHGDVAAARQAFMAGAVDFIEKPFDAEQLLSAVERALGAVRARTPGAEATAGSSGPRSATAATSPALSPREAEVMALLVQGLQNRRIADQLGISHRTVEVHKARVLEKLGVGSVVELVRLVERRGASGDRLA